MAKIFIVAILLVCSLSFKADFAQCQSKLLQSYKLIKEALKINDESQRLSQISDIVSGNIFDTVRACLGEQTEKKLSQYFQTDCITDLAKALKIGNRLMGNNKKKNILKMARGKIYIYQDLAELSNLYESSLKQNCPFIERLQLEKSLSNGNCIYSVMQFVPKVRKLAQNVRKSNKILIPQSINELIVQTPRILQTCGQNKLSEWFSSKISIECISAFVQLAEQMGNQPEDKLSLKQLKQKYEPNIRKSCNIN